MSDLNWERWLTEEDRTELYAECEHQETTVRRRFIKNGAIQYRHQCRKCGEAVGGAVAKSVVEEEYFLGVDDFDEDAHERWKSRMQEIRRERSRERRSAWFGRYDQYLRSDDWRQRRELVLKRAGGVCEGCGTMPAAHVHHLTYEHVGNEFLFELVALCLGCHERIHADE